MASDNATHTYEQLQQLVAELPILSKYDHPAKGELVDGVRRITIWSWTLGGYLCSIVDTTNGVFSSSFGDTKVEAFKGAEYEYQEIMGIGVSAALSAGISMNEASS